MTRHKVGNLHDIGEGCLKRVEIGGAAYCVVHLPGEGFYAIDDTCTHEEMSLSDGVLEGCEVECPAHGSRFDVRTGEVSGFPAEIPCKVYEVAVDSDGVYLDVP